MIPPNGPQARDLLESLGAPPRLLRHIELVGEAGEELLAGLATFGLALDADFVRAGIVLHDAGKIRHPVELHHSGILHQPAGEAFLLEHGVTPALGQGLPISCPVERDSRCVLGGAGHRAGR